MKFLTLEIAQKEYTIRLRHHANATRMTLRVAGVGQNPVVTVPRATPDRIIKYFLEKNKKWLTEQLCNRVEKIPVIPGIKIPFRGEMVLVEHHDRRGLEEFDANTHPGTIKIYGRREHFERRALNWLKSEAKKHISERVAHYAGLAGERAQSISIRDTRSRWGSCSSSGRLNFCWRLILAPPHILDYVVAHEVSHLREMNHSEKFWALCDKLYPQRREAQKWIKENGQSLHQYF